MNRDSATPNYTIRSLATILLMSLTTGACSMFAGAPQSSQVPGGPTQVGDFTEFDEDALVRMAERFESAGDYGSAMRMYGQALEKNSSSVPSLLGIARIYSAGGVTEQAESYFRRALTIEPGNPDAAAGLAGQMIVGDRGADAIAFLDNFVQAGQRSARLYNVLGVAHDLVGEHEAAQLAYSQGLDMAPENPDIMNNMALSFAIAGSYDTAIALLQEQVNNPSQRSVARQNLALVYALSGDLDAAEGVAATELTSEQLATNRVFYSRLSELSSRDRARAVYLRRFPTLEEQQQTAAADTGGTTLGEASGEVAIAPDALTESESAPARPLTAAERAEAIIRGRQTDGEEEAEEAEVAPGFETPGLGSHQTGDTDSEPPATEATSSEAQESATDSAPPQQTEIATEPTAEPPAEATMDAAIDEMFDENALPDLSQPATPMMTDTETQTADQPAPETGQPQMAEDNADMAEAAAATAEGPATETNEPSNLTDGEDMATESVFGDEAGELRYWIQVGSYRNADTAAAGWKVLVSDHADILAGLPGYVQHFTDEEGNVFYRLFANGFPGFTAANELCADFLAAGVGCFVIDTTDDIAPLAPNP